jgi:hypothetical protein
MKYSFHVQELEREISMGFCGTEGDALSLRWLADLRLNYREKGKCELADREPASGLMRSLSAHGHICGDDEYLTKAIVNDLASGVSIL